MCIRSFFRFSPSGLGLSIPFLPLFSISQVKFFMDQMLYPDVDVSDFYDSGYPPAAAQSVSSGKPGAIQKIFEEDGFPPTRFLHHFNWQETDFPQDDFLLRLNHSDHDKDKVSHMDKNAGLVAVCLLKIISTVGPLAKTAMTLIALILLCGVLAC